MMNAKEHQRERMRHWSRAFNLMNECRSFGTACDVADAALAEFDKRFPAPSAAAPVEPVAAPVMPMPMAMAGTVNGTPFTSIPETQAELASLRQKARLWDAVASGTVFVYRGYVSTDTPSGIEATWNLAAGITAEEAVEAAIAAGALK